MMHLNHFILSAALLATVLSTALAQSEPTPSEQSEELQPMFWPKEARPQLGTTSFYADFDGINVPMYLIQSGGLAFELANRQTLRVNRASSSRYSGEMTDSRIPGVSLGISVFKKGEFLSDLSEESWAAYKMGLLIEKPNIQIVLENSNIEKAMTPYVFGQQFRQIVYEQETSRGIIKRREIFAHVGSNLLVFTINGTKETVEANWNSVENLISEMTLN